jgi:coatomer subunit beta'
LEYVRLANINNSVRTGQWIGDCFVYTNNTNRLNYLVGDQTYTISHFDRPYYVLGYLARDARVYVCDRDVIVTSFALSVSVIEFQTLVLRGDMEAAQGMLSEGEIPESELGKIARFLEGQGYKEEALAVATDKEHRFELALALGQLDICLELAREADVEHKWKTVGDAALSGWDVRLAEECFVNARDLGSLLLLYSSSGNQKGLRDLAGKAKEAGQHNVAFTCLWQVADVDACLDLLLATNRTAEAVLFAQTYRPSRCKDIVLAWKQGLEKAGKGKVSRMLGVPPGGGEDDAGDEEMFPEWDEYLRLEREGGGHTDLIDVNGTANDDAVAAKAKATPNLLDVDGDGAEEDGISEQTETDV